MYLRVDRVGERVGEENKNSERLQVKDVDARLKGVELDGGKG